MKDSELLRDLISLAFDQEPAPANITLRECLDLLGRTIVAENESSFAKNVTKQLARVSNCVPEPKAEATTRVSAGRGTQSGSNDEGECKKAEATSIFKPIGVGAAEKREVFNRLSDYRSRHGLGSLAVVAKATNGVVTEDEIRGMFAGDRYPLAKWKVVGSALDFVEGTE